jgi:hypothetical protein
VFGYMGSIFASMLLFDASTKFQLRILAPILLSLLVLLVHGLFWLWQRRRELALLAVVVLVAVSIYNQTLTVQSWARGGQGFASFDWYDSKLIAFLRTLPGGTRIYTNEPEAVYLYTGRPTYVLPNGFDPVTAQTRPNYSFDDAVAALQQDVLSGHAVLAMFTSGEQSGTAQAAQMVRGLYVAAKSGTGEVYSAPP